MTDTRDAATIERSLLDLAGALDAADPLHAHLEAFAGPRASAPTSTATRSGGR